MDSGVLAYLDENYQFTEHRDMSPPDIEGHAKWDNVKLAYGSGVYAIYYNGDHPLYGAISGTEMPI